MEIDEALDTLPVFDPAALDDATGGDPEFAADLAAVYLDTSPALLDDIARGLPGEAERAAHSLKGSSRTLGLQRLGRWCEQTEHALKRGESAEGALPALRSEYALGAEALRSHIGA